MADLNIDIALPRRTFELRAALRSGVETIALIGPSGAGKTSMLRVVAGLEQPGRGRITLDAEVWFDAARRVHVGPEHRLVGYLPQDYGLFPHLDVAGNVRFAARRDRPDLLDRLGIGHLASARPGELSGGERQRVALARALARAPRVLLLDEPFGALDALTHRQVRNELVQLLREFRLPTILVTHSFDDATALADRVGVLDEGRLVQVATPRELMESPATPLVARLTGANVLLGTARRAPIGSIVRLAGGGELASDALAQGPVQVAVQPWEMEIVDTAGAMLTDVVVSVHRDRGAFLIRLTRFTIRSSVADNGQCLPAEGEVVGVRAPPSRVRVLPAGPRAAVSSS